MIVKNENNTYSGIKHIFISETGELNLYNGKIIKPPADIEPETFAVYELKDLAQGFEHMICWKDDDGTLCESCPVKKDDTCVIMAIRKDAVIEGTVNKICQKAGKTNDGKCIGYQKSETDDEPADMCMNCKDNQFYEE
jgi:hypothetical protein